MCTYTVVDVNFNKEEMKSLTTTRLKTIASKVFTRWINDLPRRNLLVSDRIHVRKNIDKIKFRGFTIDFTDMPDNIKGFDKVNHETDWFSFNSDVDLVYAYGLVKDNIHNGSKTKCLTLFLSEEHFVIDFVSEPLTV